MIWDEVVRIFSQADVRQTLGWVFATAIIIGAILDNQGKDLIRWLLAVIVFAILNAFASLSVMDNQAPTLAGTVIIFATIFTSIYCVGLSVGWFFFRWAQQKGRVNFYRRKATDAGISITEVKRRDKTRDEFITSFHALEKKSEDCDDQ